jgi:hypothetical protein
VRTNDNPTLAAKPDKLHPQDIIRVLRELQRARRLKDELRLERGLSKLKIEHAYAQHWVILKLQSS